MKLFARLLSWLRARRAPAAAPVAAPAVPMPKSDGGKCRCALCRGVMKPEDVLRVDPTLVASLDLSLVRVSAGQVAVAVQPVQQLTPNGVNMVHVLVCNDWIYENHVLPALKEAGRAAHQS